MNLPRMTPPPRILEKTSGPQPTSPVEVFVQYLGISGVQAQALGLEMEPCLCGQCQGIRIFFPNGMHFKPLTGQPEMIPRSRPVPERSTPSDPPRDP